MIQQLCDAGNDILNKVTNFIDQVFLDLATLWFWPVILIGLMLLSVLVLSFLVGFSYENRILKSVNKINAYFLSKPFITEENLVEFNLKMKKVPKVLRNNWQIYMLNREDAPTTYINVNTCIDKPLRTSSIEKNMSNFSIFTVLLTLLSFVVGLQYAADLGKTSPSATIFYACIVPLVIVLIYTIATLIIKAVKNDIYSCLYDNFPLYERNLTKAVSTLPSYVDYEILFTKKEIKEGIPILQQYLEKRALIEQQELEKARENSVACEEYNFDELGIDGSLVLERAMKECETFIKTRRRLQEECDQIETEKENYRKNFEITTKDYQRKLQASRENLESLKAQQEASTNRIESNYIKKQQGDEIKKQQQLEKDNEEATAKFNEEQVSLQQEIERRQQEIEEKKAFVQQAMLLEFKHYANTLYKALSQKATEVGNQKLASLAQENTDLKTLVNDLQGVSGVTVDPNQGMMSAQEVSGQELYEMSQSEKADLEETRQTSDELKKQEDEKEAELKAKQEEIAAQNAVAEENVTTEQVVPVAENVTPETDANTANTTNANAEDATVATATTENMPSDNNSGGDSTGETGVVGWDDGGQQMQNVEPQQTATAQEEDLDAIQKQIEEENANLQKQKQELENDLNNTISKMDAQEANVGQQVVVEEPAPQPEVAPSAPQPVVEPVVEPQPAPVAEEPQPQVAEVKQEPVAEEPEPVVEEEPEEEEDDRPARSASARRPATRSASSRGSARGSRSASASRGSARKATSEIDALNAEMQKLLDSTKK